MATTTPRSRLACIACTRRKVKCSCRETGLVPCTNCARRGEQATCGASIRHDALPSPLPGVSTSSRHLEPEYLRRRVNHPGNGIPLGLSALDVPTPCHGRQAGTTEGYNTAAGAHRDGTESTPAETDHDSVAQDAASILEFLAWGRRKDPNLPSIASPEVDRNDCHEHESDIFEDCSSLSVLQLLLPSEVQVRQLVDYHCNVLLWYHGSFYAPTFRDQLHTFWSRLGGELTNSGVDLQWVALLFSVMTGSLTCAPPAQAQSWGFRDAEQATLSRRWFQAITTCLNRGDYTTNLSIFSCQAIATATIAAHLLGFSSSQSIHLAVAVRVAQSLGLHRLGPETTGSKTEREIGRRVWTQLCSQDWFGIPFSESYLVNPLYSTSEPPLNCNDHDLVALPLSTPTITSYCRFLYDIAAIMPQLQDGLMSCNTSYTRYEQVLKWDARLRALATNKRPNFLSGVPLEHNWPDWIPWGRRALAISSSHKIIMIHRSFLSASFTNPAFAFTRRTCLAASKTIVKEYKLVVQEDGPILWIHQAFAVAAGIILSLDTLHRDQGSQECAEHRDLVETVVSILHSCRNSSIACRGIRLLEALLAETSKNALSFQRTKRRRDGTAIKAFSVPAFVKQLQEQESILRNNPGTVALQGPPPIHTDVQTPEAYNGDPTLLNHHYSFAAQGFNEDNGFENLLYLANHDFAK
ncbi:hypothetical protein P171DRAFT_463872 [Karstenula rhodostoma CBS 690.94]|uniref:Zn(2)-C6 fungal-type domain-containing protein n=1 Tax=Karstenula rhodostoma CBS 690.94 TaxID=1392251 RepID=A0A9P4UCH4_9PLEO|nr:hypothetical protein P171DRAFT_463872 [Karstenula rhodostoma CBS 690.94]